MFFSLYIYSKNYDSLNNLNEFLSNKLSNLKFTKVNKQTKKTIVTFLKSPHVNKIAQERFQANHFSKNLVIKSKNPFLILFIIKFLKKSLFLDVKFKIKFLNKKCYIDSVIKKNSNPNRLSLINTNKHLNVYLDLLNNYGRSIIL